MVCGGLSSMPSLAVFRDASAFKQLLCSPLWQNSKGLFALAKSDHSRVLCCNAGSHLKVEVDPLSTGPGHAWNSLNWATPDTEVCGLCNASQYSASLNVNKNCTPAARDQFVPAEGMNGPTNCSLKSFTNPPDSALCVLCPAGYKMIRSLALALSALPSLPPGARIKSGAASTCCKKSMYFNMIDFTASGVVQTMARCFRALFNF